MKSTDMIKITNRSEGSVVYIIPERGIRREFYPKETKQVEYGEITAVAAQPGGRELLYNFLLIQNKEAIHEGLNLTEEPEYWLTEDIIPTWINECSLDEFKDALQFAPVGVKDLIKKYSVSVPLNDVNKRQAVLDFLGFNVTSAIALNEASKEDKVEEVETSKRRVATPSYAKKEALVIPKDGE